MFRVAHNYGMKLHERESQAGAFDDGWEERLADRQRNPELSLLDRERNTRFHRAMHELSSQQQRCLFLRVMGLRYPEIGSVLGISAKTVGEFLRRAVTHLKKVCND